MESKLSSILLEKFPKSAKNKLLSELIVPHIYQVGGENSIKNMSNKCSINKGCIDDKLMDKLFDLVSVNEKNTKKMQNNSNSNKTRKKLKSDGEKDKLYLKKGTKKKS